MDEFTARLKQGKGYDVWMQLAAFQTPTLEFQNNLYDDAEQDYAAAAQNNRHLHIGIVAISLPLLYHIVIRLQKELSARQSLLPEVEEDDREYVFNTGKEDKLSAAEIIASSSENTKKASQFIKRMANSDYNVDWIGLDESNAALNADTLAGNLSNMREQLKRVKLEDEKRNWMNEGLATFSELVRNHQHDSQLLADKCVSYLTKYLNGQQASLFVIAGEEENQHLELDSCYAFDKKNWVEKKVDLEFGRA